MTLKSKTGGFLKRRYFAPCFNIFYNTWLWNGLQMWVACLVLKWIVFGITHLAALESFK